MIIDVLLGPTLRKLSRDFLHKESKYKLGHAENAQNLVLFMQIVKKKKKTFLFLGRLCLVLVSEFRRGQVLTLKGLFES